MPGVLGALKEGAEQQWAPWTSAETQKEQSQSRVCTEMTVIQQGLPRSFIISLTCAVEDGKLLPAATHPCAQRPLEPSSYRRL